jgi:hypothetical protein
MIFAHQGGWDEMLFVAIPIGLFSFLLYLANKRATAQLEADRERKIERAAGDES